jgi:hypothetical protein
MTFTQIEMLDLLKARAEALGIKTITPAMIAAATTVSQNRGWDYNTVTFAEFDRILKPPPAEPAPPPPPATNAELTEKLAALTARVAALESRRVTTLSAPRPAVTLPVKVFPTRAVPRVNPAVAAAHARAAAKK